MAEPLLLREDRDHVTVLTMNAPKSLNALSDAMIDNLTTTLRALAEDRTIRVIILRGAGKAFCAGHDLKEMTANRSTEDGGRAMFEDLFRRCSEMMMLIPTLPQPVIAEVHGIATAAGCQLVASCDLAVAADTTRFGVNGVNIGLFCSTPMVALTRNIGRKAAFEMLTTGGFVDAPRAVELGLINRSVPENDLAGETLGLAETIAGKMTAAVKIGKRAFYDQLGLPLDKAYAHTASVIVENLMRPDTAEGISAFLEKRPPDWDT